MKEINRVSVRVEVEVLQQQREQMGLCHTHRRCWFCCCEHRCWWRRRRSRHEQTQMALQQQELLMAGDGEAGLLVLLCSRRLVGQRRQSDGAGTGRGRQSLVVDELRGGWA